jgi:hypothetical protein
MEFIGTVITSTDFASNIYDVPVFGVHLDCYIDCWHSTDTEGNIEIFCFDPNIGYDHDLIENGAWYNELLSVLEDEIKSRIMAWNMKEWEAEKIQGGY